MKSYIAKKTNMINMINLATERNQYLLHGQRG